MIIILVGNSGAGKTSFVREMDCLDKHYEISRYAKKLLTGRKIPATHDNIHLLMHDKYTKNPFWQIPLILEEVERKGALIVDGIRSIIEMKRLIEVYPDTLVVKIKTSSEYRLARLKIRDAIDEEDFRRIEEDEDKETYLTEILNSELIDVTIHNNGSLQRFQKIAKQFATLLQG